MTSNGVLFVGLDLRKNILKTKSWRNFREGKPVCEDSVITYTRMRGVADTFCPNVKRKYFALWRGVEKVVRGVTSEYTRCLRPAVISRASSSPYLHKFNVKRKFFATNARIYVTHEFSRSVLCDCAKRGSRKKSFSSSSSRHTHLKVYNLVIAFSTKVLREQSPQKKKPVIQSEGKFKRSVILQN